MSKWKKALGLLLACAMLVTCFTACSSTPAPAEDGSTGDGSTTNGDTVSSDKDYDLYIFQFKVEIQEQLEEAVAAFEKENNIKIRLENAGGGVSYNDLLPSTMQKEDKPGLYTVPGRGFRILSLFAARRLNALTMRGALPDALSRSAGIPSASCPYGS